MSETVSRKSSWPTSTCLLVVSLTVVSFALISSELRLMAMLTQCPPISALRKARRVRWRSLQLCFGVSQRRRLRSSSPQSEPLRSGYRWRQGTGPVLAGRLRPPPTATFFEAEQVLLLKGAEPSAPCAVWAKVLNGHTVETDETLSPPNSPLDRAPGRDAWRWMQYPKNTQTGCAKLQWPVP